MRLCKPSWVSHDGNPIFSVDIHPDGSRFVTGGQGDASGKVVIWNMAPVRDEQSEKNENIPKMLCQMENHLACVNCVRWSHNGKFLASASDDKLVMIWQFSRHGGVSTVFGSSGKVVNVEQWRCVNTLRGHSGDVLDVAWSPHDAWLASCSIDNSIVIWNALKLPEQVAVLKGHTGLVKGVTWDPVGKYLASQSDDKSLRVWRTLDWQQEKVVTEPFKECGGTTHVLRLSWSPDGFYLVSAHAMNNSGPTAQIIEREGWKTGMDFVGHRKAVTCVRFNGNIFTKKLKKNAEKPQQYSCCAIGSRDRSLSIWLTALKRPLVVTHDLFTNSVMDASWTKEGYELLCCSWDGTVAFLGFSPEEIGNPLSLENKNRLIEKVYGKSITDNNMNNHSSQIIESAAMLNLQQEKEKKENKEEQKQQNGCGDVPAVNVDQVTPVKQYSKKQIETRTPDGRRRITPIFLAPQPDLGEAPLPFSSSEQTVFSTTTEQTKVVIEKRNEITAPTKKSDNSKSSASPGSSEKPVLSSASITPIQAMTSKESAKSTPTEKPAEKKDKEKELSKPKTSLPVKRKLDTGDKPKRPRKEKDTARLPTVTPTAIHTTVEHEPSRVVYSSSSLQLPVPAPSSVITVPVSGLSGSGDSVELELENGMGAGALHKISCLKGGSKVWTNVLTSRGLAVAGSSFASCVSCEDCSLIIYTSGGRKLFPGLVLNSKISYLSCNGHHIMAVTSQGSLYVWNIQTKSAVIKNESLVPIIPDNNITIRRAFLTSQGCPVVSLSSGKSYTYKQELGCWLILSIKDDILLQSSDHRNFTPKADSTLSEQGPLAQIQKQKQKSGSQAGHLFKATHTVQHSATLAHLENQLSAALVLLSGKEYKFWLLTYIRYLVQEGLEARIREICDDFLGPLYKSKSQNSWESHILGMSKRLLLEEILPIIGSNLRFQRLYTEYRDQLDSVKT